MTRHEHHVKCESRVGDPAGTYALGETEERSATSIAQQTIEEHETIEARWHYDGIRHPQSRR